MKERGRGGNATLYFMNRWSLFLVPWDDSFHHPADITGKFRFASFQSPIGRRLLARGGLPVDKDSFVMVAGEQYLCGIIGSTA